MICRRLKKSLLGSAIALVSVLVASSLPRVSLASEVQNVVRKKGPFGTEVVLKPLEKTYSEKIAADPALVFRKSLEFLNSIDGATVTSEGDLKKTVRAKAKLKCRMPWSFGMEIDAEYSFDLDLAVTALDPKGETNLKLRFTNVIVEPRHPDLPEGISKFEKACLDQTRDTIIKLIGLQ